MLHSVSSGQPISRETVTQVLKMEYLVSDVQLLNLPKIRIRHRSSISDGDKKKKTAFRMKWMNNMRQRKVDA